MAQLSFQDAAETPSGRVVEAVADAMGCDPVELERPLYGAVDPDALDRLCEADCPVSVSFEYLGHDVAVHGDGTVIVEGSEVGEGDQ